MARQFNTSCGGVVGKLQFIAHLVVKQVSLQGVGGRSKLQSQRYALSQTCFELPFAHPEVERFMVLWHKLRQFQVAIGKHLVGFVPRKVLVLLIADNDRLAKYDARCMGAIGHIPCGFAQSNRKSARCGVDSALRQGVVALDKVIGAHAHSVFNGDDAQHHFLPIGIFRQACQHHFVFPFSAPKHNAICCCAQNGELVVALYAVGIAQPSLCQGVYHLIIYVEREHRALVFHHFIV